MCCQCFAGQSFGQIHARASPTSQSVHSSYHGVILSQSTMQWLSVALRPYHFVHSKHREPFIRPTPFKCYLVGPFGDSFLVPFTIHLPNFGRPNLDSCQHLVQITDSEDCY